MMFPVDNYIYLFDYRMSVLKPKHSLVGKSLVPVILKFKAQVERIEECDLNRLKKGHALTRY